MSSTKLSIEREMAELSDEQRAKVLGENAVRLFKIDKEKVRASQAGGNSKTR